jgi:sigma-B regulation protein RsbU (phosphoserine phosphatase)
METKPHDAPAGVAQEPTVAGGKSAHYRTFWRKLDAALSIEGRRDLLANLDAMLQTILRDFGADLGCAAGRLYEKVDDRYVLRRWYGENQPDRVGYTVPITYAAIQMLLDRGLLIMKEDDPGFDRGIEEPLGVTVFAAMTIGDDDRYILAFSLGGAFDREKTLYLLSAIQHVIGQKIRIRRFDDVMDQARRLQASLLPKGPPTFLHYDIFGRSVPADVVGGDLYDFIPLSDRILGVAVADASGHGLPAALQARDVITGLRMGMSEHLKIVATIERLNRVINRSNLAARFVSLLYGEIEANGNFTYCSAGHPPALLHQAGEFRELSLGGMVLGPDLDARYERGHEWIRPGDTLILYSDGITEAMNPEGEDFGVDRLKAIVAANGALSARSLADLIFQQVEQFSRRSRPRDDQTVVVIRYPPPAPAS